MMQTIFDVIKTKAIVREWKKSGNTIGFVPTMGFLHEGHLSLIQKSVSENNRTVVSIFVNPTQFAPTEDLDKYPQDIQADTNMCGLAGVDLIFLPTVEEMYSNYSTFVDVEGLTNGLCGKSRPGHFRGVCTIVNKLFNITTPDRAYFGQKDAQQLAVIKKMVLDLNMDVEVITCPTIREKDGLAKSSRNSYLSPEERKAARVVSQAIFEGERLVKSGVKEVANVVKAMEDIIQTEPLAQIDYVEIVDGYSMKKIEKIEMTEKSLILGAVAVFFGKTRLIDNFIVN